MDFFHLGPSKTALSFLQAVILNNEILHNPSLIICQSFK